MLQFAKWKTALIIGICLIGVLFTAPNLIGRQTLDALPDWLPKQRLSLGLDLRGGSHLLLEVEMGAVLRERLASVADDVRSKLREDGTGYAAIGVDGDAIVVRARDAADAGKIADAMRGLNAGLDVSTDGGASMNSAPAKARFSARATTGSSFSCRASRIRARSRPCSVPPPR